MSKPPSSTTTAPLHHPTRITLNFTLAEFAQPQGYGLPGEDYPLEWIADRLRLLCELLEVIRAELGRPIYVVSGYRSKAYNDAHRRAGHGAALQSQHIEGRAADIRMEGLAAAEVHEAILRLHQEGQLSSLGGLGLYRWGVHVDVRPHRPGELARWHMG